MNLVRRVLDVYLRGRGCGVGSLSWGWELERVSGFMGCGWYVCCAEGVYSAKYY